MKDEANKDEQLLWRILAFILSLYVIGLLFSESFWGFHFFSFAPSNASILTLLLMVGVLVAANQKKALNWLLERSFKSPVKAAVLAVFFGLLFHNLTFVDDAYGDALRHKKFLPEVVTELNENRTSEAYTLNVFQPKIGEITVLNAVEIVSYQTGMSVVDVFRWIGTLFGAIFVFCWGLFTQRYFEDRRVANMALILGVCAPFIQLFFGHVEIYAPALTMISITLMCLLLFLKEQKRMFGILMLVALLFSLKFHFVSVLMIPACIIAWGIHLNKEGMTKRITWKSLWLFVMVPVVLFGIYAYVFVFEDYNDPRFLDGEIDTSERLFLPVISPEAPLDKYNLFSWSHLWDYFNMIFLWCVGGVFVLVTAFFKRRQTNWQHQGLILITMTLLFYVGLFFMVNPLLSMPIDYDLFMLPAPVFLMFSAVLLGQISERETVTKMATPILVLSMLVIPMVATNNSKEATSSRLEYLGRYTFKNYWIRSVGTMRNGLLMDLDTYEKRMLTNIKRLKPYARKDIDMEYANLLWRMGQYYRKNGNTEEALKWHLESRIYFKQLDYNTVGIVESYYLMGKYDNALKESLELVDAKYPNEKRALEIAFDCAIQAKDTAQVHKIGQELIHLFPEEPYYKETVENHK